MARKRMFDSEIINQDSFLDLPMEAKALYFLLGMEADDEGFVAPKKVLRLYGGTEDSLKILAIKKFIIPFSSGVIVITDWKRNNYLDRNRIKETIYQDEKRLLIFNEETEQYDLNQSLTNVKQMLNEGKVEEKEQMTKSNSSNGLTNVKQKLNQNSIEENSIEYINNNIYGQNGSNEQSKSGSQGLEENNLGDYEDDVTKAWETQFEKFYRAYPKKVKKQEVKKWFKKNKPSNELFSSIIDSLEQFRASSDWQKDGGQFIPYPSTWLNQKRWEDETIQTKETGNKNNKSNFEQRQYGNLDYLYQNKR